MLDLFPLFSDTKSVYNDFDNDLDNEKQVLSHPKDKYHINDFVDQKK